MKNIILAGSVAFALSVSFSACAYKTECGVDKCGNSYTDTTIRTYNNTNSGYPNNVKFSKARNQNFVTPVPQQKNSCPSTQTQQKAVTVQKTCPTVTCPTTTVAKPNLPKNTPVLKYNQPLKIRVIGQGVAPCNGTCSPAQAYAMAKRAAIADAYRLIAEKVKGVYVEGEDYIKNMMVKRSTVKTFVQATIRNANVVETTFKDGLCEVEMEITLRRSQLL